jgi:hypothetical protein
MEGSTRQLVISECEIFYWIELTFAQVRKYYFENTFIPYGTYYHMPTLSCHPFPPFFLRWVLPTLDIYCPIYLRSVVHPSKSYHHKPPSTNTAADHRQSPSSSQIAGFAPSFCRISTLQSPTHLYHNHYHGKGW